MPDNFAGVTVFQPTASLSRMRIARLHTGQGARGATGAWCPRRSLSRCGHLSFTRSECSEKVVTVKPFDFLKRIKGDEPIVCVAGADGKPVSFGPDESPRFYSWLKEHAGENIYYQLNATEPRRMKKEQIAAARFLHVDVDFRCYRGTADGCGESRTC